MPFANLFSNVAAKLFGAVPAGGADSVEPELVQLAVEAVVDAVDPRLRTVSGYARKIAPGMESTIKHMRAFAKDLPAPIPLSRGAWGSDQLLAALFANADGVPEVLGRSEELRSFFDANAALGEAHALLGAVKSERNVLAPAMVDGQLRQDVAQTTVNFSNHRLIAPGADFMACRREVGMRILRRLAELALERITVVGERATALERRKALLGARLRMLNLRSHGLQDIVAGAHDEAAEIASIERELKATVDDYVEAKASLATLESRIDHINEVFTAPADFVSYARVGLRINRMNYKVAAGSDEQAADLTLGELSIGDGLKAVIVFVVCPREELPARESLSARAARQGL